MSQAFRNQITTIAALDGFVSMLIDVIKADEISNSFRYPWNTPIKDALIKIKTESRKAQLQCKGSITKKDFDNIKKTINDTTPYFKVPGDNVYSIVSFISFSLIGLDNVLCSLKSVKKKLRNNTKIEAFENLAVAGFELVKFFDPSLDRIQDYEQADKARKYWEKIFSV